MARSAALVHALGPEGIHASRLVEGSDGGLYGTTRGRSSGNTNEGAVFRISKTGVFTNLIRFTSTNTLDGYSPVSPVLEASDGALYGTTDSGGNSGLGTLYSVNKDGSGFRVVNHFRGTQGVRPTPRGALVEGFDGWIYGVLEFEGAFGRGSVYRVRKDGTQYDTVYSFPSDEAAGRHPRSGLSRDSDGILYGTTREGGANNMGTLFQIDPREVNLSISRKGSAVELRWAATLSSDSVEESQNATNWTSGGVQIVSSNNIRSAEVFMNASNAFFRVKRM